MKHGRRFSVIGTTGSGKTTTARQIARRLDLRHVELDALHWGPDWTPVALEVFRERTTQALSGDDWVIDGNYSKVRDIVWGRADTIVWLDYTFPVVTGQLVRRTMRRLVRREELWNGNRESWRSTFLSRDSLLLWLLKTYWRRKREYPVLLAMPAYSHLRTIHLHSPHDTQEWISNLPSPLPGAGPSEPNE